MADQERRREEEVVEVESAPEQGRVSVAHMPEETATPTAQEPEAPPKAEDLETRTMAQIDAENLHSPDHVVQVDEVPPLEQKDDIPFEMVEMRESTATPESAAEIREERKLGPFTASMWFLVVAVVAFVLTLISLLF